MNGTTSRSRRAAGPTNEPIPTDLASERAKLDSLAVRTAAPVEAGEREVTPGEPGLALFPVLDTLARRGHPERTGDAYTLG